MSQETQHSPLGASGAYRWMNCGGSVELAKVMETFDDYEIEPEYRVEGSAAHDLAAACIEKECDAWEILDQEFQGVPIDKIDLPAVQTYVDYCHASTQEDDKVLYEHPIGEVEDDRPHPSFYGTVDYAAFNKERLHVIDFKYGAGILVEPTRNPQCMYYAYGILRDIERKYPDFDFSEYKVKITIVQPRTFEEKSEKIWDTNAQEIMDWAREELLPKMRNLGNAYVAGEHCRFCPAKLACPLLKGMFQIAATINKDWVKGAHPVGLGQEWLMTKPVKMYIKAIETEVYGRLMQGVNVEGTKLVQQKANRVWKDEALAVMLKKYGQLAMTEPELKSPAQVEELGSAAKADVAEYAFTPATGYTVDAATSSKAGIKMKTADETFASYVKD